MNVAILDLVDAELFSKIHHSFDFYASQVVAGIQVLKKEYFGLNFLKIPQEEQALRTCMIHAKDYKEWKTAAEKIDEFICFNEGATKWKASSKSPYYDYELIQVRMKHLVSLAENGDNSAMMFLIRAGMIRNLGGITHPKLFVKPNVGTKILIESYVKEVVQQLYLIASSLDPDLRSTTKMEFFADLSKSMGKTALVFSGGASGAAFGMVHFGVAKALFQQGLLPRIVCGASIGALLAAMICVCTDEDLAAKFDDPIEKLDFSAFQGRGTGGTRRKIVRFFTRGYFMDVHVLEQSLRDNFGDITFLEAYLKTRRILNILVYPEKECQVPILLNYLTTPDLLIRTAACASCAIPGIYDSVELLGKDNLGNIYSWNTSAVKWQDVSVQREMANERLTELFNVNNFIVSEMNLSSIPLYKTQPGIEPGFVLRCAKFCISELKHRLSQAILTDLDEGDGTFAIGPFGSTKLSDLSLLFSNPSKDLIDKGVLKGEKLTWPHISQIYVRSAIEFAIDDILLNHVKSTTKAQETHKNPLRINKKRTKSFQ